MGFARTLVAAAGLLACAAASAGVLFEHGEIARAPDGTMRVRSGLLQLELAPGVVLSAPGGAVFRVAPADPAAPHAELTVLEGAVRVTQVQTDTMRELPPGRYHIDFTERVTLAQDFGPLEPAPSYDDYRPGVRLADGVMLRQNEATHIPTAPLVKAIFRPFSQLFRRPAR